MHQMVLMNQSLIQCQRSQIQLSKDHRSCNNRQHFNNQVNTLLLINHTLSGNQILKTLLLMKLPVKSLSQWMKLMNLSRWAYSSQTHSKSNCPMLGNTLEVRRELLMSPRISSMTSKTKRKKVYLTRILFKIILKESSRICSRMKVIRWKNSWIKLNLQSQKRARKKRINYRNNMTTEKFLWKHSIKRKTSLRSGFNLSAKKFNKSVLKSKTQNRISPNTWTKLDKIRRWCLNILVTKVHLERRDLGDQFPVCLNLTP